MTVLRTPRVIRPDDPDHKALEDESVEWLRSKGFIVESNTYHDERLKQDPRRQAFIQRVIRMRNVNALTVRTRADRIAVRTDCDHSFCLEFKTIAGARDNLMLEALPLAHHVGAAKLGERCLYIFRDSVKGRELEGCFWSHLPIPIDSLWIHPKDKSTMLAKIVIAAFPGFKPIEYRLAGSGDPCVRILRSELRPPFVFPDWKAAALSTQIPESEGFDESKACSSNGAYPSKASSEMPGDLFRGL